MSDAFLTPWRTNVLEGEILMLLHNIGKMHWRFVGKKSEPPSDTADTDTLTHTIAYLADAKEEVNSSEFDALLEFVFSEKAPELTKALTAPISWLSFPDGEMSSLASLLALQYGPGKSDAEKSCFEKLEARFTKNTKKDALPNSLRLAMCAKALANKGSMTVPENDPVLNYPLGGVCEKLTKENISMDAEGLASEITDWAGGAGSWTEEDLAKKRVTLRQILKDYCSHNISQKCSPGNSVSLWQESSMRSSLYKALLADLLINESNPAELCDEKTGVLTNKQKNLALLGIRFDDDAYLHHKNRILDVIGRKFFLTKLSNELKNLLENEMCLGNEVYRNNDGICFLIPDLSENKNGEVVLNALKEKVFSLCEGEPFKSELRWKMQYESVNIANINTLKLWNTPFAEINDQITQRKTSWIEPWTSLEDKRCPVCSTCGIRPAHIDQSKGNHRFQNCDTCKNIIQESDRIISAFASGKCAYGAEYFGSSSIKNIESFMNMLMSNTPKVCLIQGILPIAKLYDGSFFNAFKSNDDNDTNTNTTTTATNNNDSLPEDLESKIAEELITLRKVGEDSVTLLKALFPPSSYEDNGDGLKGFLATISPKFFSLKRVMTKQAGEAAKAIVSYLGNAQPTQSSSNSNSNSNSNCQSTPAQIAAVLDQIKGFMQSIFAEAAKNTSVYLPISCDVTRFQILVPSEEAFMLMHKIADQYEKLFAYVRHILPLHLSATIIHKKLPFSLALDAANRFRKLAQTRKSEFWLVTDIQKSGNLTTITWKTQDERNVSWTTEDNSYQSVFTDKNGAKVALSDLKKDTAYCISPSSFDFEVLDSSTRRYDIRIQENDGKNNRRPHFMMPKTVGPRPYPIEEIKTWKYIFDHFFSQSAISSRQRKIALELVTRIHNEWNVNTDPNTFSAMLKDIIINTMLVNDQYLSNMLAAAIDGTFFDLYEWYDFIGITCPGGNA